MTAFLAWIDFDQADRDRTRRVMDLFGEEDTRDELGTGGIRDGLSDLMFPGTSTIQTRLRYMLFVPWIYQMAAAHPGNSAARVARARALEIQLIGAIKESNGVIGSEAREKLKRLPSDVYWAGLKTLGIRKAEGGRVAYLGLAQDGPSSVWATGLPDAPKGFLKAAEYATTFALTPDEAGFLRDRLQAAAADSLFARLALEGDTADAKHIWAHPSHGDWPDALQQIVAHAQRLAVAVEGASRLYNWELARHAETKLEDPSGKWAEKAAAHEAALEDWQAAGPADKLAGWDLDELWKLIAEKTSFRITPATKHFLEDWCRAVARTSGAVLEDENAHMLIRSREERLKRSKSRFKNAASLSRWGGNSGTGVLSFRWNVVSQHLRDLADAD